jgi:(2Fe-2S) ferredoxin
MKQYERHLIACDGSHCGGKEILKTIREQLGKDARNVKCSTVSCLGQCKNGPVLIVYPDGVWYHCANKAALKKIVEKHLLGGKIAKKHVLFTMPR